MTFCDRAWQVHSVCGRPVRRVSLGLDDLFSPASKCADVADLQPPDGGAAPCRSTQFLTAQNAPAGEASGLTRPACASAQAFCSASVSPPDTNDRNPTVSPSVFSRLC